MKPKKRFSPDDLVEVGFKSFPAKEVVESDLQVEQYTVVSERWRVVDKTTDAIWQESIESFQTARALRASYFSVVQHYKLMLKIDGEDTQAHEAKLDRIKQRLKGGKQLW